MDEHQQSSDQHQDRDRRGIDRRTAMKGGLAAGAGLAGLSVAGGASGSPEHDTDDLPHTITLTGQAEETVHYEIAVVGSLEKGPLAGAPDRVVDFVDTDELVRVEGQVDPEQQDSYRFSGVLTTLTQSGPMRAEIEFGEESVDD